MDKKRKDLNLIQGKQLNLVKITLPFITFVPPARSIASFKDEPLVIDLFPGCSTRPDI